MAQAVVFDMDGLMLDTEAVSLECWVAAAHEHGWEVPHELCLAMIGLNSKSAQLLLREALGETFPMQAIYASSHERYLARLRQGVPVKPGLHRLLDYLRECELPLAVATSTRRALAIDKLERHGLMRYFDSLVGGDEIAQGKPAPDIYLEAAARLGVPPVRCIALEDSEPGLRAAHGAGMACIVVPDLKPPGEQFIGLAAVVLPSLHEARDWIERRRRDARA